MSAVTKIFNPFYDFSRRQLNLSNKQVDALIGMNARATINNRTIKFVVDGSEYHSVNIGLGHRSHATRWVNDYNSKLQG